MHELTNKKIVVLGGAGLIGAAISRACASAGAHVVIADLDETKGSALAHSISARFVRCDVTDPVSLEAFSRALKAPIDGLVYAAYPRTAAYGKPLAEADSDDILKNLSLQLGGPLLAVRALMPRLRRGASVVFLASIYGVAAPRFEIYEGTAMTVPAEYAAAKGGLIALARYFAALLGPKSVRVNVVSPGGIKAKQPKSFVAGYMRSLVQGNSMLAPEDIAGPVAFLLSDASKHMTGQNLLVDDGWTL